MSEGWAPGDLALCVRADRFVPYDPADPREGGVYTVASVSVGHRGWTWLKVDGHPAEYRDLAFRKIRPLTDEERREAEAELRETVRV